MPTFKQENFIHRALDSLLAQTLRDWELWIVDDGSPDATAAAVLPYLQDQRIHYYRLEVNEGMGAAWNVGLQRGTGDLVAYLPSDSLYYREHLSSLAQCLHENPSAVAAFSSVRFNYNRQSKGEIPEYALQLVQALHRRTSTRWVERDELATDGLE